MHPNTRKSNCAIVLAAGLALTVCGGGGSGGTRPEPPRLTPSDTYLVDVLQRISVHPANRAIELTPRMWKSLFADDPLRSDLGPPYHDPPPH